MHLKLEFYSSVGPTCFFQCCAVSPHQLFFHQESMCGAPPPASKCFCHTRALSWIRSYAENLASFSLQDGAMKWYYNHWASHPLSHPTTHPAVNRTCNLYWEPVLMCGVPPLLAFRSESMCGVPPYWPLVQKVCALSPPLGIHFFCAVSPPNVVLASFA